MTQFDVALCNTEHQTVCVRNVLHSWLEMKRHPAEESLRTAACAVDTTKRPAPVVGKEGGPVATAAGRHAAEAAVEGGVRPQPLPARGAAGAARRVVRVGGAATAADCILWPPAVWGG